MRDDDARDADVIELRSRHDPELDVIWLIAPGARRSRATRRSPRSTELDHGPIRNRLVAEVLDDALDHLAIRWE